MFGAATAGRSGLRKQGRGVLSVQFSGPASTTAPYMLCGYWLLSQVVSCSLQGAVAPERVVLLIARRGSEGLAYAGSDRCLRSMVSNVLHG